MNIVFAMDSMKGSLSSMECGMAAAKGLTLAIPDAIYTVRPISDGGEGTTQALISGLGGVIQNITVHGPLGNPTVAQYGIIHMPDKFSDSAKSVPTAIIEVAAAAGITLVPGDELNPLKSTTFGVGEMILDAINEGCRNFIIGLGGSATNDGGIGMLQALGVHFFDINSNDMNDEILCGEDLQLIKSISLNSLNPILASCTFEVACDVNNPLFGENGASFIFGPQKGAFEPDIELLDDSMKSFAEISAISIISSSSSRYTSTSEIDPYFPGCGAAGGLGFAFHYYLNATLRSGVEIIIDETNLEKYISQADIVITGEGRIDSQTQMGKTPIGVAKLAKKYNLPVIALAGEISTDFDGTTIPEIDAYFSILRRTSNNLQAMNREYASKNLTDTSFQIFSLIKKII